MSTLMIEAVSRFMDANGGGEGLFSTPISGVNLIRARRETVPNHMIYNPSLCITVQGVKDVVFGAQSFEYGGMQALVVSLQMPALGRVKQASASEPYLGITIDLDVGILREVMEQLDVPPKPTGETGLGVFLIDVEGPLADCVLRLVRMSETPKAIPVLHPLIMREICFWLLTGESGNEVCKLAMPDSHAQRVATSIFMLRDNYAQPIRIEQLAEAAHMSPSSFHQHFKALTSTTPLQYQKQLRLIEARRLMLTEAANVETAAYQVGYESPSQFSREYSRMFGTPPKRDVTERKAEFAYA